MKDSPSHFNTDSNNEPSLPSGVYEALTLDAQCYLSRSGVWQLGIGLEILRSAYAGQSVPYSHTIKKEGGSYPHLVKDLQKLGVSLLQAKQLADPTFLQTLVGLKVKIKVSYPRDRIQVHLLELVSGSSSSLSLNEFLATLDDFPFVPQEEEPPIYYSDLDPNDIYPDNYDYLQEYPSEDEGYSR